MQTLGLIGYPLDHSFSKKYFTEKFEKENVEGFEYRLFPLEQVSGFTELCEQQDNLLGLNVTIPYKVSIIAYLDELDNSAEKIGAVNVIKIQKGKKIGYNSDFYGFKSSLQNFIPKEYRGSALVLGTGGASRAITFALEELYIPYQMVSRNPANGITYQTIKDHPGIIPKHQLIINTTPLGTFPHTEKRPDLPYEYLNEHHLLYDLVYNPQETAFMKAGLAQGAKVKNGYEMLIAQAEKAWEIWTGEKS